MIAAAASLSWLVGVLVPVFLLLFTVIGWFVRRELSNKEKEIKDLESKVLDRLPALQKALYGHQPEEGPRTPGVLERLEHIERQVDDNEKSIKDYIHKEISIIDRRTKQSEKWLQDEGEKTRQAIQELQNSVAKLTGEISTLMNMLKSQP